VGSHTHKSIDRIVLPDWRPCAFFSLQGVSDADPGLQLGGNPWFAVPKTHEGYKEIVATVLLASATGRRISVNTTGEAVPGCSGLARVNQVILEP
jgi:hypothetical protein